MVGKTLLEQIVNEQLLAARKIAERMIDTHVFDSSDIAYVFKLYGSSYKNVQNNAVIDDAVRDKLLSQIKDDAFVINQRLLLSQQAVNGVLANPAIALDGVHDGADAIGEKGVHHLFDVSALFSADSTANSLPKNPVQLYTSADLTKRYSLESAGLVSLLGTGLEHAAFTADRQPLFRVVDEQLLVNYSIKAGESKNNADEDDVHDNGHVVHDIVDDRSSSSPVIFGAPSKQFLQVIDALGAEVRGSSIDVLPDTLDHVVSDDVAAAEESTLFEVATSRTQVTSFPDMYVSSVKALFKYLKSNNIPCTPGALEQILIEKNVKNYIYKTQKSQEQMFLFTPAVYDYLVLRLLNRDHIRAPSREIDNPSLELKMKDEMREINDVHLVFRDTLQKLVTGGDSESISPVFDVLQDQLIEDEEYFHGRVYSYLLTGDFVRTLNKVFDKNITLVDVYRAIGKEVPTEFPAFLRAETAAVASNVSSVSFPNYHLYTAESLSQKLLEYGVSSYRAHITDLLVANDSRFKTVYGTLTDSTARSMIRIFLVPDATVDYIVGVKKNVNNLSELEEKMDAVFTAVQDYKIIMAKEFNDFLNAEFGFISQSKTVSFANAVRSQLEEDVDYRTGRATGYVLTPKFAAALNNAIIIETRFKEKQFSVEQLYHLFGAENIPDFSKAAAVEVQVVNLVIANDTIVKAVDQKGAVVLEDIAGETSQRVAVNPTKDLGADLDAVVVSSSVLPDYQIHSTTSLIELLNKRGVIYSKKEIRDIFSDNDPQLAVTASYRLTNPYYNGADIKLFLVPESTITYLERIVLDRDETENETQEQLLLKVAADYTAIKDLDIIFIPELKELLSLSNGRYNYFIKKVNASLIRGKDCFLKGQAPGYVVDEKFVAVFNQALASHHIKLDYSLADFSAYIKEKRSSDLYDETVQTFVQELDGGIVKGLGNIGDTRQPIEDKNNDNGNRASEVQLVSPAAVALDSLVAEVSERVSVVPDITASIATLDSAVEAVPYRLYSLGDIKSLLYNRISGTVADFKIINILKNRNISSFAEQRMNDKPLRTLFLLTDSNLEYVLRKLDGKNDADDKDLQLKRAAEFEPVKNSPLLMQNQLEMMLEMMGKIDHVTGGEITAEIKKGLREGIDYYFSKDLQGYVVTKQFVDVLNQESRRVISQRSADDSVSISDGPVIFDYTFEGITRFLSDLPGKNNKGFERGRDSTTRLLDKLDADESVPYRIFTFSELYYKIVHESHKSRESFVAFSQELLFSDDQQLVRSNYSVNHEKEGKKKHLLLVPAAVITYLQQKYSNKKVEISDDDLQAKIKEQYSGIKDLEILMQGELEGFLQIDFEKGLQLSNLLINSGKLINKIHYSRSLDGFTGYVLDNTFIQVLGEVLSENKQLQISNITPITIESIVDYLHVKHALRDQKGERRNKESIFKNKLFESPTSETVQQAVVYAPVIASPPKNVTIKDNSLPVPFRLYTVAELVEQLKSFYTRRDDILRPIKPITAQLVSEFTSREDSVRVKKYPYAQGFGKDSEKDLVMITESSFFLLYAELSGHHFFSKKRITKEQLSVAAEREISPLEYVHCIPQQLLVNQLVAVSAQSADYRKKCDETLAQIREETLSVGIDYKIIESQPYYVISHHLLAAVEQKLTITLSVRDLYKKINKYCPSDLTRLPAYVTGIAKDAVGSGNGSDNGSNDISSSYDSLDTVVYTAIGGNGSGNGSIISGQPKTVDEDRVAVWYALSRQEAVEAEVFGKPIWQEGFNTFQIVRDTNQGSTLFYVTAVTYQEMMGQTPPQDKIVSIAVVKPFLDRRVQLKSEARVQR